MQDNGAGSTSLAKHKCPNDVSGVGVVVENVDVGTDQSQPQPQVLSAPPTLAKKSFNALLVRYFGEEMIPVEKGLLDLGQKWGQWGRLDAEKMMPHPTTLARNIVEEGEKVMEVVGPAVAEAVRDGRCSSTSDMWTDSFKKDHFITVTAHFVNKEGSLENYDLFTSLFESNSATSEEIRADLLRKFSSIGISPEEAKNIEFVTDGGSNIRNALQDFKWHYCLDHALNLCEEGAFTISYMNLITRALDSAPEARDIIQLCDSAVREAKPSLARRSKKVGKGLHFSNWATQSHVKMLSSFLLYRGEIEERLRERESELLHPLSMIYNDDVKSILVILGPLDIGGDREKSPSVTTAAWPALQDHVEPDMDDSPMILAMKDRLRAELVRMEAVSLIERCKDLVAFFKRSPGLMSRLSTSLKQEVSTRWNSHLTLLRSIQGKMNEINTILSGHSATTGNLQHLSRTEGISEVLLNGLVAFLTPFEKESKRLEGEGYPTIAMAATSIRELLDHCAEKPDDCEVLAALRHEAATLLREKAALDLTQMTAAFFWPNMRRLRVLQQEDRDRVMANIRRLMREEEQRDAAAGGGAAVGRLARSQGGDPDPVPDDPGEQPEAATLAAAAQATSPLRFGSSYIDVDEEDDEVDSYISEKGMPYVADPLQWWREHGCKKYPKLWRIARRHLAIMASSAPSERVWSKTGLVITPRRSRIGADLVH
ncbi:Transposable element Hobo transposase, partial [Frankliniella fusca]